MAIDVTAMTEGDEYRFIFRDSKYPYVLRLCQATIGNEIYRGLGLRAPWFEGKGYNAWYHNGFMDIFINQKPCLSGPGIASKYPLLFNRCEIMETGKRALVQYIWEREEATVRLRFLAHPDSRALLAEILIDPKQQIDSLIIKAFCFPGAYTSDNKGKRRLKTAVREEKSVTKVELNPQAENWMLFYDQQYDMADPVWGKYSMNGCAGLYLHPDDFEIVKVELTGYTVEIKAEAKKGVTRLRFAFDELPMAYTNALTTMLAEAPKVQGLLKEDIFQPAFLSSFDLEQEQQKVKRMASGNIDRARIESLNTELINIHKAIVAFKANVKKTVKEEQAILLALESYTRQALTVARQRDEMIRIFEVRGIGHSKYELSKAVEIPGKDKAELTGGYLYLQNQGAFYRYIKPFPVTREEMYRYDVFVLMDIDTRAIPPQQINMLREYVEDGGGLIMFGGYFSYGASNIKDTVLYELLPVTIEKAPLGLRKASSSSVLKVVQQVAFLQDLSFDEQLVCPWYHELVPRNDAQVVIVNGDAPWLVIRPAGKGRVIACAGTILGNQPPDKRMFYDWSSWQGCLWRMIKWASGKNG